MERWQNLRIGNNAYLRNYLSLLTLYQSRSRDSPLVGRGLMWAIGPCVGKRQSKLGGGVSCEARRIVIGWLEGRGSWSFLGEARNQHKLRRGSMRYSLVWSGVVCESVVCVC